MLSGSLALFDRALKSEAHGLRGHLLRLAFAASVEVALLIAAATSLTLGAPGLAFFQQICWLNVVFIGLAGVSLFATAVTEEKEEGTLGLLQMANVGRAAIMLGKSTSRLVAALLLLGVQVPFVLLAITLGGVLLGQISAAFVCLAAFLFLTANVGLLWSVLCRRSATAAFWTGLTLVGYFALPSVVLAVGAVTASAFLAATGTVPAWATDLRDAAPAVVAGYGVTDRLAEIFATGYARGVWSRQAAFCGIAGLACFVAAWLGFERFADADRAAAPDRGMAAKTKAGSRAWARPRRNPLAWKEFRFLVGGGRGLALRTLTLLVVLGGVAGFLIYDGIEFGVDGFWEVFFGVGLFTAAGAVAVDSLFLATRILSEERKWNTLGNLLLLPKSTAAILWGKVRGVLPAFLPALLMAAVCGWGYATYGKPANVRELFDLTFSPVGLAVLAAWCLYLVVVAYLSTVVRYGAVPLAAIVYAVGSYALSPVFLVAMAFGGVSESTSVGTAPIAAVLTLLTAAGAVVCVKRFETLAEQ